MPVKIRLSRHGRKKAPFYHIVVADSRAPRDGRFIDRIGSYNPITDPATIELNFDRALDWLQKGAQPTDTARAILSYKGVLLKKHLLEGVAKGAITQEQAEERFQTWIKEKESKIQAKKERIANIRKEEMASRIQAESKIRETREQELAKKLAAEAASEAKESAKEEQQETPAEDSQPEEPAAKPQVEEPVAEAKDEEPVAEAKDEEPVAETKDEKPVADKQDETPASPEQESGSAE